MKLRNLLVVFLFALSLGGEALHTLQAHHDASHCSICAFQVNDVGSDGHAAVQAETVFVPHETPAVPCFRPFASAYESMLFGRAPPLSRS